MNISKKRVKELKKELKKKRAEKSKSKVKPMRPIFYKTRSLGVGVEIDWGLTSRYMHA